MGTNTENTTTDRPRKSKAKGKTVCPLFAEYHTEEKPVFADDMGDVQLFRLEGQARKRVPVADADYRINGNKEEMFEFNFFKTSKRDLERQFGGGPYYIFATYKETAEFDPELIEDGAVKPGKMMPGAHGFDLPGVKKRGGVPWDGKSVVDEPDDEDDDEDEDDEDDEETEKLKDEVKALREEMKAMKEKPVITPLQQVKDLKEAADIFTPRDNNTPSSREQHWKDALDDERRQSEKNLATMRSTGENNLSTLRAELTQAATITVNRYEDQLAKLRQENQNLITTMATQLSEARQDTRKELERRDGQSDGTLTLIKEKLSNAENALSKLRMETDQKVSELIGSSNTMLLEKSMAKMEKDFIVKERDSLAASLAVISKEVNNLRNIEKELNETIFVMKRDRTVPSAPLDQDSGFHIPPMVSTILMTAAPVAVFLFIKWLMDTGKPVPPEAKAAYEKWKRENPPVDTSQNEQAAKAAEEARQTRERSDAYEAEQREKAEREAREKRAAEAEKMRASVAEAEAKQTPPPAANGAATPAAS